MSHQTFYRKYRSNTFADMVGQTHIIRILQNALSQDQLGHAYIFSGPRGTGKTSAARILAKALNCESGPTPTPCGTCPMCQKIAVGQSVDVIEIDAASNNGVDNIRTVTEQVYFAPVEGKYKVYIIDEVHMLSSGAFNALLKTLEEPPTHVLFLLATTEIHKIPATILSRCQHLNFRRLSVTEISHQLQTIASKENFTITEDAQIMIARQADGCMRDALSLLEQILAFEGNQITVKGVASALGSADKSAIYTLADTLLQRDIKKATLTLQALLDAGVSAPQLTTDLIDTLRHAVLVALAISPATILDPMHPAPLESLAKSSLSAMQELLKKLCDVQNDLRFFPNPSVLLHVHCLGFMTSNNTPVPQSAQQTTPTKPSIASTPAPRTDTPSTPTTTAADNGTLKSQWANVITAIKENRHALFSILNQSEVIEKTDTAIVIRLKQDFRFFREKLAEENSQLFLASLTEKTFGKPLKVQTENLSPTTQKKQTPLQNPEKTGTFEQAKQSDSTPNTENKSDRVFGPSTDTQTKKINHIVALFDGSIVS